MRKLSRLIRLFRQDEKGNVLIMVTGALFLLMGMAALVIDVGGLYGTRRHTVNAADAAVLAAALEKNENKAETEAVKYADLNYNANLEGIVFTYPSGSGQGGKDHDGRITTVLVSKQVGFSFARVLGFDETDVYAMASAQRGVGNGLVPFALVGHPCYCCYDCHESDDPNCTEGDECGCICACIQHQEECDPPCPERDPDDPDDPDIICKLGYEGKAWKIINDEGVCAKPGDYFVLKSSHHMDGDFESPGNFQLLEFPDDDQAVPSLRNNIGGGYDGPLEDLIHGTPIGTEKGSKVAIESALERRLAMADDPPCTTLEELYEKYEDPYRCDLVVVIPLVEITSWGGGDTLELKIVGYASFLLDFSDGVDGHEVPGYLLEYLTYDELEGVYGSQLTGFVYRLIQDPPEAKETLLNLIQ